jgi:hypothetical protein
MNYLPRLALKLEFLISAFHVGRVIGVSHRHLLELTFYCLVCLCYQ